MGAAQSPILTYGGGIVPGSLLMHLTGLNNGTTFTDVYGSGTWVQNTATASPPYTVTSTTETSPFAGVGSALYSATAYTGITLDPLPAAVDFGSGDFTVEFWAWTTSTPGSTNMMVGGNGANNFVMGINTGTKLGIGIGGSYTKTATLEIPGGAIAQWNSYAYCRKGGQGYLFVNGILDSGSPFTDGNVYGTTAAGSYPGFAIGGGVNGVSPWTGYISEIRITAGFARYTTSYTPATAPFSY